MLTGVVLARNEAANIVECLTALKTHVEELIVIDMESSDSTVELARPLVDQVLTHPLVPNFDAARNDAIAVAKHDWLWFVDADERVSPRVGQVVRMHVLNAGDAEARRVIAGRFRYRRQIADMIDRDGALHRLHLYVANDRNLVSKPAGFNCERIDDGTFSVRMVNENGIVRCHPVDLCQ